MSRTFSTSKIHRDVSQHQGQAGSNQKSTRGVIGTRVGSFSHVRDNRRPGCGYSPTPRWTRSGGLAGNARLGEFTAGVTDSLPVAIANLTRTDAARRAELLDVGSYDVTLDLTDGGGKPGDGTFRSRTVVRFTCREPGAETFIDVIADNFAELTLNGEPVDASPTVRPPVSR